MKENDNKSLRIEGRENVVPLSFLMIGQSNMAGRGDIGECDEIDNERCFVFRMTRWQRMSEPINIDRTRCAEFQPGVGLAASFADSLSRHLNAPVGLIPCALGGTSIAEWEEGTPLFENAVFNAGLAMRSSRLGGILWHQGEDDCHPLDERYYSEAFIRVMNSFRAALRAPKLPIVVGELGENIDPKYGLGDAPSRFNRLLSELVDRLPAAALASSRGVPLRSDGIHFSSAGARIMGVRYFEKYLSLI